MRVVFEIRKVGYTLNLNIRPAKLLIVVQGDAKEALYKRLVTNRFNSEVNIQEFSSKKEREPFFLLDRKNTF